MIYRATERDAPRQNRSRIVPSFFACVRLRMGDLVVKASSQGIRAGLTLLVNWGVAEGLGSGKGMAMREHTRY